MILKPLERCTLVFTHPQLGFRAHEGQCEDASLVLGLGGDIEGGEAFHGYQPEMEQRIKVFISSYLIPPCGKVCSISWI